MFPQVVQDQLEDQIIVCFASLFCDKCGDLTPDMSGQPLECTQASQEGTQAQPEPEPSEPVGTLRRSETSDLNDNKGDETQLMVPLSAEEVKRARSLQATMLRQLGNPGNRNRDSGLASFISVPRSWKAGTPVPGLPDHLQPDARGGVTNTNICCSPESPCSLYAYGCGLIAPKLQRPIGLARERHEAGWGGSGVPARGARLQD